MCWRLCLGRLATNAKASKHKTSRSLDIPVVRAVLFAPCAFCIVDGLPPVLVAGLAKGYNIPIAFFRRTVSVVVAMMGVRGRRSATHSAWKLLYRLHVRQRLLPLVAGPLGLSLLAYLSHWLAA